MTTLKNETALAETTLGQRDLILVAQLEKWVLEGRFCALLGPPASGKTTALRLMSQNIAALPQWTVVRLSLRDNDRKNDGYLASEEAFLSGLLTRIKHELRQSLPDFQEMPIGLMREWLKAWVRQTERNLLLVLDNLDAVPNALASRFLDEMRPLHAELRNKTARVLVVVASTSPITNLTTGITSPFYNLARTEYTKPLNRAESRAWAKECFSPHTPPPPVLRELLHAACGDATLIKRLIHDGQQIAKQRAEPLSAGMIKEARNHFLVHTAPTYPRFVEAKKMLKAKPALLAYAVPAFLRGKKLKWRDVPLNPFIDAHSLALTGLARLEENEEKAVVYEVLNDVCLRYLKETYPNDKLGHRFAATGFWAEAVFTTPKPKSKDEVHFCDTSLNAVLVADTLENAVHIVTHTLEKVYDLRGVVFWLRSSASEKIERIRVPKDANGFCLPYLIPKSDGIVGGGEVGSAPIAISIEPPKTQKSAPEIERPQSPKPSPEALAVWQQDVQVVVEENRYVVPLIAPKGSVVGTLSFQGLPDKMRDSGVRNRRFLDMQDYIGEAAGALEQAIKRHKREKLLPEVIGEIARLTADADIWGKALEKAALVIPFNTASVQVYDIRKECLVVQPMRGVSGRRLPLEQIVSLKKLPDDDLKKQVLETRQTKIWVREETTTSPENSNALTPVEGYKAWMGVPLLPDGSETKAKKDAPCLGILAFYSDDPTIAVYQDAAKQIAQTIAAQLKSANAAKRVKEERNIIQLMTASIENLQEAWKCLLEGMMKITGAEVGNVGLINPIQNAIDISAVYVYEWKDGIPKDVPLETVNIRRGSVPLTGKSVQAYVAKAPENNEREKKGAEKRSVLLSADDEKWGKDFDRESLVIGWSQWSEVGVPILDDRTVPATVLGIINLEDRRPKAFSEEDKKLLEELAVHAKIAILNSKHYEELNEMRLRASVTAIMARNMSHNIGSHGLSYLSNENIVAEELNGNYEEFSHYVAHLNAYLRERMDFIASVPTVTPTWSVGLDCVQNIIAPVWGPMESEKRARLFLLLNTIVRSEYLRASALRLHVRMNSLSGSTQVNYGYTYPEGGEHLRYEAQEDLTDTSHKVAVYMGTTGLQALYGFLENFIRNSAKHSVSPRLNRAKGQARRVEDGAALTAWNPDDTLTVTLEFDYTYSPEGGPAWDRNFVRVRVYDNMESEGEEGEAHIAKTVAGINNHLMPPSGASLFSREALSRQDDLHGGLWGLKEMLICASFLRGLDVKDYGKPTGPNQDIPPILRAEAGESGAARGLGYVFYLPRVKDLLIFGKTARFDEKDWAELARAGVYQTLSSDDLARDEACGMFNHSIVVINADENNHTLLDWFRSHADTFPVKTLLASQNPGATKRLLDAHHDTAPAFSPLLSQRAAVTDNALLRKNALLPTLIIENTPVKLRHGLASEKAILEAKIRWLEHIADRTPEGATLLPRVCFVGHNNVDQPGDELARVIPIETYPLPDLTNAVVVNHKWERLKKSVNTLRQCRFYAPYRSTPGTLRNRLMDLLGGEEPLGKCEYPRLNAYADLMEAALTNVIVIDERIFRESHKRAEYSGNTVLLNHLLQLQNVAVFDIDKKEKQDFLHAVSLNEWAKKEAAGTPEIDSFCIDSPEFAERLRSHLPAHFRNQVHFLIIHQTIVQSKMSASLDDFLEALGQEFRPRWLVVTSGRGKPEGEAGKDGLHPAARFLEYSNLRRFTVDEPDKLLLAQTLYALKESRSCDKNGKL